MSSIQGHDQLLRKVDMGNIITKRGRLNSAICGTTGGYRKHIRNKEISCKLCKIAINSYSRTSYKKRDSTYKIKVLAKYHSLSKEELENRKVVAKLWRKNNPEKVKETKRAEHRKRKARKFNVCHSPYTEQQVLEKYGTNCHICKLPIDLKAPRKAGKRGWEKGLHIDHKKALSKGGEDNIENVRPAHGLCNVKKWAN